MGEKLLDLEERKTDLMPEVEDVKADSGENSEVTNTNRFYSSSTSYMASNSSSGPNYY